MSDTLSRINSDLKTALKSGEGARVGFLRFVRSHIQNREIEKRGKGGSGELTEEEVREVLRKEAKRKKESIELFRKGSRGELAEKEEQELRWLMEYLPPVPTRDDIVRVVKELKEKGVTDFSAFMKEAMPRLEGADGKEVSVVVKEML